MRKSKENSRIAENSSGGIDFVSLAEAINFVVPAKAGTHTPRPWQWARGELHVQQ
ncbi:hypothetical protein [Bradyrhizobium sp. 27S5]|uniref:hypothetical protein n=1 Tax=Bradyrhizobium sp. 27S5 TaxID=3139728 RepID=UPI0030D136B2